MDVPVRIDGWKAIAGHFRRDRSTVMRWAEGSEFPVHRVSGRKGGSVYAYAHELEAWLAKGDPEPALAAEDDLPLPTIAPAKHWRRPAAMVLSGILAFVMVVTVVILMVGRPLEIVRRQPLPTDPATADLYLLARDDWTSRTPDGLRKAMGEFAAVIARDPTFAPADAGLADCYILAREFAAMPDAVAFPKAQAAAKAALAIDPGSADANRALGFIDWWQRHDINAARAHFRRALEINPGSAQTHFWYGNILTDARDVSHGLSELRTARLLDPGSAAILADYAWDCWNFGAVDAHVADLETLAVRLPGFAPPHRYLSFIRLAQGDVAGSLSEAEKLAQIQNDSRFTARILARRKAFQAGGPVAALSVIANETPTRDGWTSTYIEEEATAAAMTGRREKLVELLARGEKAGDVWSNWRVNQPRFALWRSDPLVIAGLARVGGRALSSPEA